MPRPTFFLLVDAIPWDVARQVWAEGELPGFAAPRPTVSVFPSLTEVAVPSLLRGIFHERPPGYEARYFDPESGETRGGFSDPEADAAFVLLTNRVHPEHREHAFHADRRRFHAAAVAALEELRG